MAAGKTIICIATLVVSSTAVAHHSFAMFDGTVEKVLDGTVKEFQWTNPHSWIQVNVKGADGKIVDYSIEGSSPNILSRKGWTRTSLEPGDHIVLTMHPLKDGAPGGSFVKAVVNGKTLEREEAPPPATARTEPAGK